MVEPLSFTLQKIQKHIDAQLHDVDQRKVALGLSEVYISNIDDQLVQSKLRRIRDIIWYKDENDVREPDYERDTTRGQQEIERVKALLEELPDDKKSELAAHYVRLGHIYEIAGHAARENFFHERTKAFAAHVPTEEEPLPGQDLVTPGGVYDLLFHDDKFKDMEMGKVIDALSAPVSEYVFTQHPTNTNTLQSMKQQRAIADALDKVTHQEKLTPEQITESWAELSKTVTGYSRNDIVQPKNFTAHDETNIVINFLGNAFKDIDRLYDVAERGLKDKFNEYDDAARWKLDLKQRFASWGSAGDKDGNGNIKSENTLEAIILHKMEAAQLFADSLGDIPAMAGWKATLGAAKLQYQQLETEIKAISKEDGDIPLTNAQFEKYSLAAQKISETLDIKKFRTDLAAAAKDPHADAKTKEELLKVDRKARIFGFNLGKIEYRETAEEYERVVKLLVEMVRESDDPDYKNLKVELFKPGKSDIENLSNVLNRRESREDWAKFVAGFMEKQKGEELRQYKKLSKDETETLNAGRKEVQEITASLATGMLSIEDTEKLEERRKELKTSMAVLEKKERLSSIPIAYHTLRRMELARDFSDMTTHNVLAECKGTENLLQALALQVATTVTDEKTGGEKRAKLHIVPLFEEADTMGEIPNVLSRGLENEAYHAHLDLLKERDGTAKIVQQIQIAHSDNARRAGAIASRGIIHEGHHAAREAIKIYNATHRDQVELEFFEGGSQSDSYRNGVRAVTAAIRDFNLGSYAKMTFQGGDLLNYFNQPTSAERLMLRSIVEQAKIMQGSTSPGLENGHTEALEQQVRQGLSDLQHQYDAVVYDAPGNPIGRLLYEFDYRGHIAAGNAGSRAPARGVDPKEEELREIDATAIRTIGFSEALQHEGIHPTFMGAGKIRQTIESAMGKKSLSAAEWKKLYDDSPSFKDAIDKLAYSIMNSNLKKAGEKLYWKMGSDETLKKPEWNDKNKKLMHFMAEELPNQYVEAGKLVYEAMTGQSFTYKDPLNMADKLLPFENPLNAAQSEIESYQTGNKGRTGHMLEAADRMRHLIKNIEPMERYEALGYKHRYVEGLAAVESSVRKVTNATMEATKAAGKAAVEAAKSMGAAAVEAAKVAGENALQGVMDIMAFSARMFHNARDTLYHGRTFVADDPKYGAELVEHMKREREKGQRRE